MEYKRNKVIKGLINFIPKSINFYELEEKEKSFNDNFNKKDIIGSDEGLAVEKMEQDIHFEELIIQMLYSLEGREKVVFLYQLLRDFGYQIDHTSFARTINLKRNQYMNILATVRLKTFLVVKGYQDSCVKQTKTL